MNLIKNVPRLKSIPALIAITFAGLGSSQAYAFSIATENSDVEMRWDNTIRYNGGWRAEKPNAHFSETAGYDETEGHFQRGDMITNRIDLLSEFDFTYKSNYGFRVSTAIWSENAYGNKSTTSSFLNAAYGPYAPISNYGSSGQYSSYAKRYTTGTSGEFLDAFVFGNINIGDTSLKVKVGQHNIYWGEALYTIADGVSAGMGPIDTIKAATSPGAEAKELFLPVNRVSMQWSLSDEVSLIGQYALDWKPFRLASGGTYFGTADGAGNPLGNDPSCAQATVGGFCVKSLAAVTPDRSGGDLGLGLRWTPYWLNGTAGFYYRKYDEKLPWSFLQLGSGLAGISDPNSLGVGLSYARNTELIGVSLSKSIAGISVGSEISYRHNTALNSVAGFIAGNGAEIPLTATPSYSQVEGARGDTWHAVVNGIWLMQKTAFWDSGVLQGELSYQRLGKVTKNPGLYFADDYVCKNGYALQGIGSNILNKSDGCSSKDSLAFNVGFTPEWPMILPGIDLSMPTSFSYGLKGNSPTIGGANEGAYKWSIGLKAKYQSIYEFSLAYNDGHANYKTQTPLTPGAAAAAGTVPGTTVYSTMNGSSAGANHRGWLSFTFKTSF